MPRQQASYTYAVDKINIISYFCHSYHYASMAFTDTNSTLSKHHNLYCLHCDTS